MPSTLCPAERQRGVPRRLFVPTKPGSILRIGGPRNVTRVEGMECWRAKNPLDATTILIRVWGVLVEPVKQGGSEPFAKANTAPTSVPSTPSTPNTAVTGTR